MNRKFIRNASIVIALIVGFSCLFGSGKVSAKEDDAKTICDGVTIQGLDVGGLSEEEAKKLLSEHMDKVDATILKFRLGDATCEIATQDLKIKADIDKAVKEAYAYGHVGNILERYKEMKDLSKEAVDIDLSISLDEEVLKNKLNESLSDEIVPPENASITCEDGKIEVVDGKDGHELNAEETVDHVVKALLGWKSGDQISVEVATNLVKPEHTTEELSAIKDELGVFETKYSLGDTSRNNNIANAANKVNGSVVYPGEEFDTMEHLVPFTTDNGWSYAGAYLNGEVITDIGGGICQLSTTLYNAVLRAELEVTERHPHSMAVGYVPLSADAALNEGSKNFKFINNTDSPVYVYAWAGGGTIHVSIFGKETRSASRTIEYENEVLETIPAGDPIETIDESQPADYRVVKQSAHTGFSAKLWKHIYENGELVDTVLVNSSYYSPSPERVTIGKPAEAPPEGTPEAAPETPAPETPAPTEAPATEAPATEAPVQ